MYCHFVFVIWHSLLSVDYLFSWTQPGHLVFWPKNMCPGPVSRACVQGKSVLFPILEGAPWTPTLDTYLLCQKRRCPSCVQGHVSTHVSRSRTCHFLIWKADPGHLPWTPSFGGKIVGVQRDPGHRPGHRSLSLESEIVQKTRPCHCSQSRDLALPGHSLDTCLDTEIFGMCPGNFIYFRLYLQKPWTKNLDTDNRREEK